jgi:hypothetical protein
MYFQLRPLTRHIEGIESGLLLTPGTVEIIENPIKYQQRQTKRTKEKKNKAPHPGNKYNCLTSQILFSKMLPTPRASDYNPKWPSQNWKGTSDLNSVLNGMNGTKLALNPLYVLEMMGFPSNWTELPFQNGERSQLKQQETQ